MRTPHTTTQFLHFDRDSLLQCAKWGHTLLQSAGLLGRLVVPFSIILIVVLLFFRISRHFLNSLHGCLNASLQLIRGSFAAISVSISIHFPQFHPLPDGREDAVLHRAVGIWLLHSAKVNFTALQRSQNFIHGTCNTSSYCYHKNETTTLQRYQALPKCSGLFL